MAIGHAARPNRVKRRRYEFVGWEFKPNKQGHRRREATLREWRANESPDLSGCLAWVAGRSTAQPARRRRGQDLPGSARDER